MLQLSVLRPRCRGGDDVVGDIRRAHLICERIRRPPRQSFGILGTCVLSARGPVHLVGDAVDLNTVLKRKQRRLCSGFCLRFFCAVPCTRVDMAENVVVYHGDRAAVVGLADAVALPAVGKYGVPVAVVGLDALARLAGHRPAVRRVSGLDLSGRVVVQLARHAPLRLVQLVVIILAQIIVFVDLLVETAAFRFLPYPVILAEAVVQLSGLFQLVPQGEDLFVRLVELELDQLLARFLEALRLDLIAVCQLFLPVLPVAALGESFGVLDRVLDLVDQHVLRRVAQLFADGDLISLGAEAPQHALRRLVEYDSHMAQLRIGAEQLLVVENIFQSRVPALHALAQPVPLASPGLGQGAQPCLLCVRQLAVEHLLLQSLLLGILRMVPTEERISCTMIFHLGIVDLPAPFSVHALVPAGRLADALHIGTRRLHFLRFPQAIEVRAVGVLSGIAEARRRPCFPVRCRRGLLLDGGGGPLRLRHRDRAAPAVDSVHSFRVVLARRLAEAVDSGVGIAHDLFPHIEVRVLRRHAFVIVRGAFVSLAVFLKGIAPTVARVLHRRSKGFHVFPR